LDSGVAMISDARGKQSHWPLLTEIMNFKKIAVSFLVSLYLSQ